MDCVSWSFRRHFLKSVLITFVKKSWFKLMNKSAFHLKDGREKDISRPVNEWLILDNSSVAYKFKNTLMVGGSTKVICFIFTTHLIDIRLYLLRFKEFICIDSEFFLNVLYWYICPVMSNSTSPHLHFQVENFSIFIFVLQDASIVPCGFEFAWDKWSTRVVLILMLLN